MARSLQNYLRMYRRRAGLSQNEVAFVLGSQHGAQISRYERFASVPTLKNAIALELLYGVPVGALFAGTYDEVKAATMERVAMLTEELTQNETGRDATRKLQVLGKVGRAGHCAGDHE